MTSGRRLHQILQQRNLKASWCLKLGLVHPASARSCSIRPHGEAGSVDAAVIAQGIAVIRGAMAEYEPRCVSNADQTGLLHRMLPRRAYQSPGERLQAARGAKGMVAKDRMTLYPT